MDNKKVKKLNKKVLINTDEDSKEMSFGSYNKKDEPKKDKDSNQISNQILSEQFS